MSKAEARESHEDDDKPVRLSESKETRKRVDDAAWGDRSSEPQPASSAKVRAADTATGGPGSEAIEADRPADAQPGHWDGVRHVVHDVGLGMIISAKIAGGAMDVGHMVADSASALNVNLPNRDHSISEMVEHRQDQEVGYVADNLAEAQKRANSDEDSEIEA